MNRNTVLKHRLFSLFPVICSQFPTTRTPDTSSVNFSVSLEGLRNVELTVKHISSYNLKDRAIFKSRPHMTRDLSESAVIVHHMIFRTLTNQKRCEGLKTELS